MKVTALIPDRLVGEVAHYAAGRTLTESLIHALSEWLALQKITRLNHKVRRRPVQFALGYSAAQMRNANRRR